MKAVLIAVVASLTLTATGAAQSRTAEQAQAMAEFRDKVAAYVELAKRLSDSLPPLKRTDDAAEIASREAALGRAIREARASARPGDVFTRAAANEFQHLIRKDFRRRSPQGRKLVLDEIPHFHPKVNMTYPGESALATFPVTLLAALPTIPDGLEYRLLSDALILRDVKANLIIDFILDVF